MIWNYLRISLRNIRRSASFSVLNILGLTVGFTASLLILLYIHTETSYDQFHKDKERIHRVTLSFKAGEGYTTTTTTSYLVAPMLTENFSGIESSLRMYYAFNTMRQVIYEDKTFDVTDNYTAVDSNFFSFFSFELLQGNPATALTEPNSIVITESEAFKIFGPEDAMGKTIALRSVYSGEDTDLRITGIMKDIPTTSHIPYQYYISMKTFTNLMPGMTRNWGWTSQNTYIKMKPGANVAEVNDGVESVIKAQTPEWFQDWARISTQPLTDIHLKSNIKEEIVPGGDITYVRMLRIIAIFILAIAIINYMNLATSMASKRMKEIGVKKIVGATKAHLTVQFLFESFVMLVISLLLSITITQLAIPPFNTLTGNDYSLIGLPTQYFLFGGGIIVLLGLLSGSYPALFLSSFKIVNAISGNRHKFSKSNNAFRKGLVITQFIISSFLICSTLVILRQWTFLRNQSLGMDTEQVVSIPLNSRTSLENYQVLRTELLNQPNVLGVGTCSKSITGRYDGFGTLVFDGEEINFPIEYADQYFFDLMEIDLVSGRYFNDSPADSNAVIINRKAMEQMGIEDPVGKSMTFYGDPIKVVGVVENFHFEPLYTELGPLLFFRSTEGSSYAYAKINITDPATALNGIRNIWTEINPGTEFDYQFASSEINQAYQSEQDFFWIFILFTGLAIFIACLGLFGLVSFSVSQKVKEIGIRKVLGASSQSVLLLLSRSFVGLILVSSIISWPIIYMVMNSWLEKFPYRIDIGVLTLFAGTVVTLFISVLVISGQSVKASLSNPIKSLRYE